VVAAVLGVWWAGAAYVAVSPADPPARAAELLDDAGCGTVLTREALRNRAGAGPAGRTVLSMPAAAQGGASTTDSAEPSPAAGPDDVSHITYTSGTTGRPSGVVAHHRGVANYLSYVTGTYRLEPSDVTLQLAPVTFDAWLRDTIAPLTAGAAVVVLVYAGQAPKVLEGFGFGAALLGVPIAWLTARSDLPARRAWAVLAVVPLAIPSYVTAFAFIAALGPRGRRRGRGWLRRRRSRLSCARRYDQRARQHGGT
jgi:hypothetical protein